MILHALVNEWYYMPSKWNDTTCLVNEWYYMPSK